MVVGSRGNGTGPLRILFIADLAQSVERRPSKSEATSSSLVVRSMNAFLASAVTILGLLAAYYGFLAVRSPLSR